MHRQAHRGRLLHCLRDPGTGGDARAVEYLDDGVLLVEDGHVAQVAPAAALMSGLGADVQVVDHDGALLLPGLIDCHVHYPQTDIIAAPGRQLLDWLERHVFPLEARFADPELAAETADFFLDELLRNGTTTALVFATVHPVSVDAIFEAAKRRKLRLAAGRVLMDRNCPDALRDEPDTAFRQSLELLERWHGCDRLHYAITPRFAPACSDALLRCAGELAARFPQALVHSHLAENRDEVAMVSELFPDQRSYLEVYRHFGLLRERAVFAHCIHLDEEDYRTFAQSRAAMAYCPSSNLFLGSGLFDLARAREHGIPVGVGTDVGGGTSFSLLRTLADGYKGLQLKGQSLHSLRGLYLATLGAAEALHMDAHIGNFSVGKEADFIVVDTRSTALMERRVAHARGIDDELFALMMLGDDRAIRATYVMGVPHAPRSSS